MPPCIWISTGVVYIHDKLQWCQPVPGPLMQWVTLTLFFRLTGVATVWEHSRWWGSDLHSQSPDVIADGNLYISALKLLCIVVACKLWGHMFSRRGLVLQCDNEAVCMAAVNDKRGLNNFLQAALRELWSIEASFNFTLICAHIPGLTNRIVDELSRYHSPTSRRKL